MTRLQRLLGSVILLAVCAAPAAAQFTPEERARLRAAARAEQAERARQRAVQARARNDAGGPEVIDRFSRTIRLGRTGALDLSNVSGDIVITGGSGSDIQVDAIKRTRHRDEAEARARLQDVEIQVREQGRRVEVRTQYPRERRNVSVSVDYTVAVPEDAEVVVKSVSGDLRISNVRGVLRAETVSGDIDASGARRLESARTVSGDLRIAGVESDEPVTMQTVSGNQNIRGLKARGLYSTSVSGDVLIEEVETERGNLKTVSGNITYNGRLARNGRYDISSHSGDIRLGVADIGFEVEANTFSGNFRSDYALKIFQESELGRRRGLNRMTRGSYGDSSAVLTLRTFSGNIVVTKR